MQILLSTVFEGSSRLHDRMRELQRLVIKSATVSRFNDVLGGSLDITGVYIINLIDATY